MHTALGRLKPSLRRYYVVIGDRASAETLAFLSQEHPDVTPLSIESEAATTLFGGIDGADPARIGTWFVVDPGGFLMMHYSPEHSYKQAMADLKFLYPTALSASGANTRMGRE